jgi:CitMHS family citrate-Mg2+:H+ or citrate-Ca2+:H+ symporter
VIIGVFGVPLGMLFSPDAYYFALLPIVRDVAVATGVPAESVARAMLIGENIGFCISPVVASVYLAIGLAGVELRSHIRYTFLWAWALGIVLLVFAILIGVVTI